MTKRKQIYKKTAPTGPSPHRLKRIASVVVAVTALLFITTLVTANTLATRGGDSSQISSKIQNIQDENSQLAIRVARLTSISRIYSDAQAMGYVAPSKLEKVAPANPVALRQ